MFHAVVFVFAVAVASAFVVVVASVQVVIPTEARRFCVPTRDLSSILPPPPSPSAGGAAHHPLASPRSSTSRFDLYGRVSLR